MSTNSILIVSPFFTGLRPWLLQGKEPAGMPGIVNLVKGLQDDGYQVNWLIISKDTTRKEIAGLSDHDDTGVCIQQIPRLIRIIQGINPKKLSSSLSFFPLFLWALFGALRIVKTQSVRIIYVGGSEGLQLIGSTIARLTDIPNVSRIFGTPLGKYLESEHAVLRMVLTQPLDSLSILAPCDLLVITDDGTRGDQVARLLNAPKNGRLLFLRNGVDTKDKENNNALEELGLPLNTKKLAWVSRFDHWKRVDIGITAMRTIAIHDPETVLLIVGYGEREEELRQLVEELSLRNRVLFLGMRSARQVRDILHSCDIYLSTYNWYANLSNTLMEALSDGCCIVTLRDPSTEKIVIHEKTGILIEKDHPEKALADTVNRLLTHPKTMIKAGRRGRLVARALGSWKKRIRKEISQI